MKLTAKQVWKLMHEACLYYHTEGGSIVGVCIKGDDVPPLCEFWSCPLLKEAKNV
jgi:hypothetical protein